MQTHTYTNVFKNNLQAQTTVVLNEGGARSSKSYSMCQLFIHKLLSEHNKNFLITRKTLPSLRITAYKMFIDLLEKLRLYDIKYHNKTNRTYTYNSNYILFTSLDYPTRIQSTEFNYIWMEEAEEFDFDDFMVLKTRLSSPSEDGKMNQIFLTYNPKNAGSYINRKVRFHDDVTYIRSTYLDNPFISKEYTKTIESLKNQDSKLYSIYALGEYAEIEGQVYNHIRSANSYPGFFDETFYGLDFGYNNPTCLLRIDCLDSVYYVTELLYETKLTTTDVIHFITKFVNKKTDFIYADPSAVEKIAEIKKHGYNIKPALNAVISGIDCVKSRKVYTRKSNTNFNKELNEYVWRKDLNGNLLDLPVKYNDHAMDALRYAMLSRSLEIKREYRIRFV
ncbi:MAG: PBSX family phage terminase large subunit [Ignavibacteria bacterium]|nr:PBSX family phage terminase large subunit [Ignavibacteria bacterium]